MNTIINYEKALEDIEHLVEFGYKVFANIYILNDNEYLDRDLFIDWQAEALAYFNSHFGEDSEYYSDFKKECRLNTKACFQAGLAIIKRCKIYIKNTQYSHGQNKDDITDKKIQKVFISHSTKDKKVIGLLIDLIEAIGIPQEKIFCSSFEGYGIKLGENFLSRIKTELNSNTLVLFALSNNFYMSKVCLCEMGASWIRTREHIPVLIPPFDFKDIEGVIPLTQGFKINDTEKLNSFKKVLVDNFELKDLDINAWERKRNNFIEGINREIATNPPVSKKNSITKIKAGDLVLHGKFGKGEVLEVSVLNAEEIAQIRFESWGIKKLNLRFAKLTVT